MVASSRVIVGGRLNLAFGLVADVADRHRKQACCMFGLSFPLNFRQREVKQMTEHNNHPTKQPAKRGRPEGSKDRWPSRQILEVRSQITAELDEIAAAKGPTAAIDEAVRQVSHLRDDLSDDAQLRSYTYIMSALVRYHRHGAGLSSTTIDTLSDRAFKILMLKRVTSDNPRLGYLAGDLHMVLSQVYRLRGYNWRAAWSQQMGVRLYRNDPERSKSFRSYGLALRALRLGNTKLALEHYTLAEVEADDDTRRLQARLGRIKSLRLSYELEQAQELLKSATKLVSTELPESVRLDLAWEGTCLEVARSKSIEPLMALVRRRSSHYSGDYLPEATLWSFASTTEKYQERLPRMSTLRRSARIDLAASQSLIRPIEVLETVYDKDYPLDVRLQNLGSQLSQLDQLEAVDWQLLYWLAAARWLLRRQNPVHHDIALGEYRALCLRLSHGKTDDVLGLASDLVSQNSLQQVS